MPTPDLPQLPDNPNSKQLIDYVVKLQRDLDWLLLNLDDLNVRRITADSIYTGTLDANVVTVRSDLTSGYIQIDGNGMVINNGAYNTFEADMGGNVTMTSARIRSAAGYPLVELNYNDNLVGAYTTEDDAILLIPMYINDMPAIQFVEGGTVTGVVSSVSEVLTIDGPYGVTVKSEGDIRLQAGGINSVFVDSWGVLRSVGDSETLQDALDTINTLLSNKATIGNLTSSAGGHNHGIASGTQLATTSDGATVSGYVTWVAASGHQHTQA